LKTLILVRHAKSGWKNDPAIEDFDRPLNRRGERDAPAMAARLAESGIKVDALLSSPACRALSTAEAFSRELNLPIQTDARIYEAGVAELQAAVRDLDDANRSVALFGHNPGISDFLRYLTEENFADLPTAGIAVIELPLKSWKHTFGGKGFLKNGLSPGNDNLGARQTEPNLRWADRFRFWCFQKAQRLEIILVVVIAALLLLLLVPFVMHQSINSSAMPQQGSATY
jgi:phosphohistidine phosphatase